MKCPFRLSYLMVAVNWSWFYNMAGGTCVGLAFLGVFLPLLPTTPFLLLAVFCFSRGSPRLHSWLLQHRTFGPLINDWREHRRIHPQAKRMVSILIIFLLLPLFV